jgi:hypothetical protein
VAQNSNQNEDLQMRKQLMIGLIAAVGFNLANACAINLWNGVNTATAANTQEPTPTNGFSRFSGKCGLRIAGAAAATYVEDISVSGATTYKARFYVFTGTADTTGTGYVYLARSSGGAPADLIRIAYTGGNLQTTVAGSTAAIANIPAAANLWHSVELEWANGTAQPFSITVQGLGAAVTQTGTVTQAATLGSVRLGLSAGATGIAQFDEYDSRRTTAPGRLNVCDVNNDGIVSIQDRIAINTEILNPISANLVIGQGDANRDGIRSIQDRIQINNRILNTTSTCNL